MDRCTSSPEPSLEAQPEPSLEAQPEPILKVQPDFGATKDQQICTITVRVIKSFEFRTIKHIVLRVDTARTTVGELKDICTNSK
ncbi:hypothetical protein H4S07_002881 [Coemansia furcata]|uniref:Uncharacterized protein n=1 Tax=Coemansia furcata TaxID=417177 RepID=A0ACC1LIC1_9FUNG|nr:hypothetical protein H4S07_002881 [Coemansia furcata]